jgi:hypothetical protein
MTLGRLTFDVSDMLNVVTVLHVVDYSTYEKFGSLWGSVHGD